MKIRCNRWAALAVLAVWASQARRRTRGAGRVPGARREPGNTARTGKYPSQAGESETRETRPWEAAQEELRPGVRKSMEERRRVGRKARKEQLEKRNMENVDVQPVGNLGEQMRERPNKWRRHQMESERYYPMGMR